jgi:hypothetical protein
MWRCNNWPVGGVSTINFLQNGFIGLAPYYHRPGEWGKEAPVERRLLRSDFEGRPFFINFNFSPDFNFHLPEYQQVAKMPTHTGWGLY